MNKNNAIRSSIIKSVLSFTTLNFMACLANCSSQQQQSNVIQQIAQHNKQHIFDTTKTILNVDLDQIGLIKFQMNQYWFVHSATEGSSQALVYLLKNILNDHKIVQNQLDQFIYCLNMYSIIGRIIFATNNDTKDLTQYIHATMMLFLPEFNNTQKIKLIEYILKDKLHNNVLMSFKKRSNYFINMCIHSPFRYIKKFPAQQRCKFANKTLVLFEKSITTQKLDDQHQRAISIIKDSLANVFKECDRNKKETQHFIETFNNYCDKRKNAYVLTRYIKQELCKKTKLDKINMKLDEINKELTNFNIIAQKLQDLCIDDRVKILIASNMLGNNSFVTNLLDIICKTTDNTNIIEKLTDLQNNCSSNNNDKFTLNDRFNAILLSSHFILKNYDQTSRNTKLINSFKLSVLHSLSTFTGDNIITAMPKLNPDKKLETVHHQSYKPNHKHNYPITAPAAAS